MFFCDVRRLTAAYGSAARPSRLACKAGHHMSLDWPADTCGRHTIPTCLPHVFDILRFTWIAKAHTPLLRSVVDLLCNKLYKKSTTTFRNKSAHYDDTPFWIFADTNIEGWPRMTLGARFNLKCDFRRCAGVEQLKLAIFHLMQCHFSDILRCVAVRNMYYYHHNNKIIKRVDRPQHSNREETELNKNS